MTNKPIDGLAASFLIIFSILLGLNQVLVKLVNVGMHPVFQVALRSTLAIFPILIYCYLTKKKINFFDGSLVAGIIAGVLFAVEFIFLFTALDYSTVTRVSLIFYTMPVWLSLSAHFLIKNDKLNFVVLWRFLVLVLNISPNCHRSKVLLQLFRRNTWNLFQSQQLIHHERS